MPSAVEGSQVAGQVDGRGVVTRPNAFCGILDVAFHGQEVCGDGC